MSNAKGSDNKKVVATPSKVVASSRSEAKGVSTQNLRQTVQKAVAMPASAVRAAVASARTGAAAVRVAYDVISRLLTLLESGIVIDKATLQTTKSAIDAVGITDDVSLLSIGKAYNDVCTLNDVLIRVINYHRTYEEYALSEDQPAKTLQKNAGTGISVTNGGLYESIDGVIASIMVGDPTLSYEEAEQIALSYLSPIRTEFSYPTDERTITVGKNFFEVIELPETFTKVVSFVREPAEVLSVEETRSFVVSKPKDDTAVAAEGQAKELGKPLSDTYGLSDSDVIAFTKAVDDIMSGNDARTLLFTKKIEDFILATDQFLGESGVLVFNNSEIGLTAIADQLERVVNFVRFFPDTTTANESMARVVSKPKNEPLTVDEKLTRVVSFNRTFTDTSAAAESLYRVVDYQRAYTDTSTINETSAKSITKAPFLDTTATADAQAKSYSKPFSDANNAGDSFSRIMQFSRSFNSTANAVAMADVIATIKQFNRAFAEVPRATDLLTKDVYFRRFFNDTNSAADAFSKTVSFVRSFGDTSGAVDAFSKVVSYSRTIVDTSSAAETMSRVVSKVLTPETSSAADQITSKYVTKTFADILRVGESLYFSSIIHPDAFPPADTQRITDSFAKLVTFVRSYANTAAVAQTDTIQYTKVAGESIANIWSDFNDLGVYVELCQYYPDYRVEYLRLSETLGKNLSKRVGPFTYYTDATWTDFAELSVGLETDQEIAQEFWRQAYSLDHDLVTFAETFSKTVSYVRSYADTAVAPDTTGRVLSRTVGDSTNKVFEDFADLFYTQETYSNGGGYGATVTVERRPETIPNLLTYTNNLSQAIWQGYCGNKSNITYNTADVPAPNGTYTATKVQRNNILSCGASTSWGVLYNSTGFFEAGKTYTVSFYARVASGTASGYVGPNDYYQEVKNFDTNWQRYTVTFTPTASPSGRLDRGIQITCYTLNAAFYIWGPQVELGTTASKYREVGSSRVGWSETNGFIVDVTNPGVGYSVGQQFKLATSTGYPVTIQVTSVDANNGIRTISIVSGSYPWDRTSMLSDVIVGYTLGTETDQDLVLETTNTYAYTSVESKEVGPRTQSRHNVLGQDLLLTLRNKTDGDKVSYAESSARTFTKVAVDPYPQGFWSDYNELTFGSYNNDQELMQSFEKFKPTSVQVVGAVSLATLGLTKTNSLVANLLEVKTMTITKAPADTATTPETFAKVFSKTAGEIQVNTWTDLQEFIFSGVMGIDYGTKYDAVLLPDQPAKNFTKTLYFDSYVWRDYNDLTFATSNDQELLLIWADRQYTDITRVAEDARKTLGKSYDDPMALLEGIGKEVGISAGDGRYASYFRDWMGLYPIGEHGIYGAPILDEELTLTFTRGSKTDFAHPTDSAPKTITKAPVITVAPYWSDFAELTFGTQYDQELLQYQEKTRPETIRTFDLYQKIWSAARTFNDTVTITDSALISLNGGPLFTLLMGKNDIATGSETLSRFIGLAAGDVPSYYSTWEDFAELTIALELAQYYYRGTDSTVDIGKIVDQRANLFTKQGGRTQNIMDYSFNEELFYDRDLLQTFAQDYVTEIILPIEVITLNYGKIQDEPIRLTEEMPRVITKPYVGDTTVSVDRNIWNPLYISGVSNYEEDIRFGNYPDTKIDKTTIADADANTFNKQAGFDRVNQWVDYLETARSVYDLTLLTYGYYGSINNAFAQPIFNRYLDEIVDEEHYEMMPSWYRTELIAAADYFFRAVTYNRSQEELLTAMSQPSIQFSPAAKVDTASAGQTNTTEFTKAAGERFQVWQDYLELHPFNELAQNFPDFKTEWLTTSDIATKIPTKGLEDTAGSFDSVLFVKDKNRSDLSIAADAPAKGYGKALGDQSTYSWVDSYEVLSFDPKLLTFGAYTELRTDIARSTDAVGKTYSKQAGGYRAHIWTDYTESDNFTPFNDLLQYYPDYVTELIIPADVKTISINKGLTEIPRATDSGAARLFSPNGYATITPTVYFADDYEETIETSTF